MLDNLLDKEELIIESIIMAYNRPDYLDSIKDDIHTHPEVEQRHAKNVLKHSINLYELKYNSKCPSFLKIAAAAHDCDRVYPNVKVKIKYDEDYEDLKQKHADNCAFVATLKYNIPKDIDEHVKFLISRHETGGSIDKWVKTEKGEQVNLADLADILMTADTISGITDNVDKGVYWLKGLKKTFKKINFYFSRLNETDKEYVKNLDFSSPITKYFIENVGNEITSMPIKVINDFLISKGKGPISKKKELKFEEFDETIKQITMEEFYKKDGSTPRYIYSDNRV